MAKFSRGFTLVELLIGITILAVIAGVAGDMVISTIRSYNKSQVLNTVTQNGNYALGVWRDDMQNAKSVDTCDLNTLQMTARDGSVIVYNLVATVSDPCSSNGSLSRNGSAVLNTDGATSTVHVLSTGVGSQFSCPDTDSNSNLYTLVLSLGQSCAAGVRIDNTASTTLRASVVVRGGYN